MSLLSESEGPSHPSPVVSRRSMITGKHHASREVRFGVYVLGATLGEGEFGKVKLGWRKDGLQPSQAAIKLIRRDTIPHGSEKESKIHREINALKRLRHPNIVRLVEVLQNDKYIGIVLEYASGGELFDYILEHRYLKESMACRLFAQLVSGVDYMHSKGLVHRDLKLENLLLDKHKNIIISDFGFVNSFRSNDMMRTSCGSPCYAAPELVISNQPYQGTKVDVWSCGVILYAMLAGYLPYDDDPQNPDGENIARLYHYITSTRLTFPEYITPTPRDLLRKIIVPDPQKRIPLHEVRAHPWLAPHAPFLSVTPGEWDLNYKAARVLLTQSDKAHRRYSLMENPTTASLMLNKHAIKSYSSHSVSQSLYAHPAIPQTSRTVAISSSPSSSELNTNFAGPQKVAVQPAFDTYRGSHHRRNGSSASVALQAVVEADNAEHSRRNSVTETTLVGNTSGREVTSRSRPFPRPLTLAAVSVDSSLTTPNSSFVPLDTLIRGKSDIDTIVEGSENSTSVTQSSPTARIPPRSTRPSRPRPTSYHPGLVSTMQVSGHDFAFQTSSVKLETASANGYSLQRSSTANSRSSSPIKESSSKRNSWCQPKISEPALDMSLVNGVLTKLNDSTIANISETQMSHKEKRKSIALDSLSNAMEVFTSEQQIQSGDDQEKTETETETETGELDKEEEETRERSTLSTKPTSSISTAPHHPSAIPTNMSRVKTSNSEKENHTSLGTSVTNKFKRFSLLSFYSKDTVYETAHSTVRHSSHTYSGHHSTRKPLEPNNRVQTVQLKSSTVKSASSTAQDPITTRRGDNSSSRTASGSAGKNHDREPSTAKRVMDFFRRRSIRI
ncbi:DEKNAAC105069 [Brettanomyces naardenensis]|uniref:non-specific serine/threonine protein kinase n=1 Tax=Brettanomyces naardenensis TaxID=13370 RepID=A0A448YS79_BRENA|nr:DEKNAAC105069 [Brettanomyces naardenensis]